MSVGNSTKWKIDKTTVTTWFRSPPSLALAWRRNFVTSSYISAISNMHYIPLEFPRNLHHQVSFWCYQKNRDIVTYKGYLKLEIYHEVETVVVVVVVVVVTTCSKLQVTNTTESEEKEVRNLTQSHTNFFYSFVSYFLVFQMSAKIMKPLLSKITSPRPGCNPWASRRYSSWWRPR